MTQRYTQQEVEQIFEDHGFILQDVYTNNHSPMCATCSCGSSTRITLKNILHNQHCLACRGIKTRQQLALSQEYVADQFTKRGFVLLSQYTNSQIKLKCQCPNGHIVWLQWANFSQGHGCSICAYLKNGQNEQGSKHHNWNPDREAVNHRQKTTRQYCDLLKRCKNRLGTERESLPIDDLDYSAKELMEHIEAHWNYTIVSNGPWAIDHILPIKAFHDHGSYDPKVINALDNLMPRSQHDNCEKSDWYREEDFLQYRARHNIVGQPRNKENLS